MTPTIVTTHGGFFHHARLALVVGSPGGSTIPTTVTNDILSALGNGLSVQQTSDAPRFHHQYLPDELQFEKAFPHATVEAMQAMGYKTTQTNEADTKTAGVWGGSELILIDAKTGELQGANDPRYPQGKVASY
jgi:gamma-glutamyltranspeptidase/glutathione hydrolase